MSDIFNISNISVRNYIGDKEIIDIPPIGPNEIVFRATIDNLTDEQQTIMVSIGHYHNERQYDNEIKFYDIEPKGCHKLARIYRYDRIDDSDVVKCIILDKDYKPICPSINRPYFINNESDFINISSNLGLTYILNNDINLENHKPFEFYGTFNGNNHVIQYNINDSSLESVGLFSKITNSSEIKDLYLQGNIISNNKNVGSLVGSIESNNNVRIHDIISSVNITSNCYDTPFVGGIIGTSFNSSESTDIQLYNLIYDGNINRPTAKGAYLSGIIGCSRHIINNCIFIGNITSVIETYIAGIIGLYYGRNKSITKCACISNISGEYVGTILNMSKFNTTLNNCYSINNNQELMICRLTDGTEVKGEYCYTTGPFTNISPRTWVYQNVTEERLKDETYFSRLDFDNIWKMTDTHPILRGTDLFEKYQEI